MIHILLDLDGVLVDFVGGLCAAHGRENPYNDPRNHGIYEVQDIWKIPASEFWRPTEDPSFWTGLQWMQDGYVILNRLEQMFTPEHICILTSPTKNPSCAAAKLAWIQRELPAYKRRYLLGPAKAFCAAPNHILIDDSERNIDAFLAAGGKTLLIPRPWNRLHGANALKTLEDYDV